MCPCNILDFSFVVFSKILDIWHAYRQTHPLSLEIFWLLLQHQSHSALKRKTIPKKRSGSDAVIKVKRSQGRGDVFDNTGIKCLKSYWRRQSTDTVNFPTTAAFCSIKLVNLNWPLNWAKKTTTKKKLLIEMSDYARKMR